MANQGAYQSRRYTENGYRMMLHQRPKTIRTGIIQRAVVKHHCCAMQGCAEDFPWPHHPTHVGDPIESVGVLQVEAVRDILRGFDRKTAM